MPYDPSRIEPYWQAWWESRRTFVASEDFTKPKFYALDMFPYPSGKGLHVGHPASYIAGDVVSRKRRAEGFNVLHPMGYDAFGLPAEQKAIEEGVAPQLSTDEAIANFRRQLKMCGFSYDWTRELSTHDPAYYKWTQWIFTQLHARGLAYEEETLVNWCPALGTVLANDEVIDGVSERGGHPVERRLMKQWMIRMTAYAEQLLAGLDTIDWPEATRTKQRERIGRSTGALIEFAVAGQRLEVFTTRPDTLWGVTYLVLAPEHPLVDQIAARRDEVDAYRRRVASLSEIDRQRSKTGVDTGARATHPVTGQPLPVWIADYVLAGYGTGAIMGVPAHDERDREFAETFGLPIALAVREGVLVSGELAGQPADPDAVTRWLADRGLARATTQYKLRDWTFARQRYWGEPIPILKHPDGTVARALRPDELPLVLPPVAEYAPTGTGESPLARATAWVAVDGLVRETQTMPGSAGSSWYHIRYCDPHNDRELCARAKSDYWLPVDLYIGGPEHAVGHLMYARMWQRFLAEQGVVRDAEPYAKLRHQGMIQAVTYYEGKRVVPWSEVDARRAAGASIEKRIEKMSKRKHNVVAPETVIREHGADAMRIYLCFLGPLDANKPWAPEGIEAQRRFLARIWRLYFDEHDRSRVTDAAPTDDELRIVHRAVAKVSADIERLALNTAIAALHVAEGLLWQLRTTARAVLAPLCQLIQPFAPPLS
jgi:leucyl-tRNA synthetase